MSHVLKNAGCGPEHLANLGVSGVYSGPCVASQCSRIAILTHMANSLAVQTFSRDTNTSVGKDNYERCGNQDAVNFHVNFFQPDESLGR